MILALVEVHGREQVSTSCLGITQPQTIGGDLLDYRICIVGLKDAAEGMSCILSYKCLCIDGQITLLKSRDKNDIVVYKLEAFVLCRAVTRAIPLSQRQSRKADPES